MIKVPTFQTQSSDFSQRLTFDGVEFSLRIAWNTKSQYWMINEYREIDSDRAVTGVKITPYWPLLYQYRVNLPGQLIVLQTDNTLLSEITYDSLGNGHDLFYLEESEFEDWREFYGFP